MSAAAPSPSPTRRSGVISLSRPTAAPETLGYFRFGRFGDRVVLTNDVGEWHFLDAADFDLFVADKLPADHPDRPRLLELGFLREGLDLEALAARLARKRRWVGMGPHLHIIIATLRCNQDCRYCHASRTDMDQVQTDMSLKTAKQSVDLAMQTTSPYVNFEFQGGEPTINMDVIKFVTEYAREKNRHERKELDFSLVTNMTYMDEDKAQWLVDNDVMVCTSLDGPRDLHDWNRTWRSGGGSAFDQVMRWMRWFNKAYIDKGLDPELWHVDALMTTTQRSLERARDIVDLYLSLRIRNVFLRPLNPFGFATRTWQKIGYSTERYLAFYEEALDYIIELNLRGEQIIEGTAAIFLKKMLTPDDPNFVDIRSPVGAGTGQVAYNYDGAILPSDEGRMVHAMGDPIFQLGTVDATSYMDVVTHPTVKSLAVASLVDSLPMCSDCWNAPYCGVRPLHNYMQGKDLFAQRPNTPKCKEHMGIGRLLLERLDQDTTGDVERIFRRWVIDRPRVKHNELKG